MNEKNPLYLETSYKILGHNKRGRPRKSNEIKFGPQPQSYVSQILKKAKMNNIKTVEENITLDTSSSFDILEESDRNSDVELVDETSSPSKEIVEMDSDKKFRCDFNGCTYACKLLSNLTKHKRIHSLDKPYLCDLCPFRSRFVNSLKSHKRIHFNEKPYSCTSCSYCCNSSSNLKKHYKNKHTDKVPSDTN